MPVDLDDRGQRRVTMDLVLPGTPEDVWPVLATGPGNEAWFTKTTVEGRVGGAMEFDFGTHGTSAAEVLAWEPPHRFAYVERAWAPGAPPVATEITITARSGDACVMRMAHTLWSTAADWDEQLEGFEQGWPQFFDVLRLYLTHFRGRPAALLAGVAKADGAVGPVWKRLTTAFGCAGLDAGDACETDKTPFPIAGVVERVRQDHQQRAAILRLATPGPALALIGAYATSSATNVIVHLYFYGDEARSRADTHRDAASAWLAATIR